MVPLTRSQFPDQSFMTQCGKLTHQLYPISIRWPQTTCQPMSEWDQKETSGQSGSTKMGNHSHFRRLETPGMKRGLLVRTIQLMIGLRAIQAKIQLLSSTRTTMIPPTTNQVLTMPISSNWTWIRAGLSSQTAQALSPQQNHSLRTLQTLVRPLASQLLENQRTLRCQRLLFKRIITLTGLSYQTAQMRELTNRSH